MKKLSTFLTRNIKRMSRLQLENYAKLMNRQIREASELLTAAGVPEMVTPLGDVVPGNAIQMRVKWFVDRRKNVAAWELGPDDVKSIKDLLSQFAVYGKPQTKRSGK